MQYPVSGEQNPFVSWPQPHQTNPEKSVIELEEFVYWKEYRGSATASYKTGDGTEQTYPGEEKQQRCSEDSDVNGKLTFMSYEVNPVNNFDSFI